MPHVRGSLREVCIVIACIRSFIALQRRRTHLCMFLQLLSEARRDLLAFESDLWSGGSGLQGCVQVSRWMHDVQERQQKQTDWVPLGLA